MREVEERPASAASIIRHIAERLSELADNNEQLLAENVLLRTGEKIDEYESRIAILEQQLEMLKRQVGDVGFAPQVGALSLLIYDALGRVLRIEIDPDELDPALQLASFPGGISVSDEAPNLLVVDPQEELLFVFDSGRTVSAPVVEIPAARRDGLEWERAFIQEPRGSERLATILPIGKMALFEFCVQVSRRGYVKKLKEAFLEVCIANANVGSGVLLSSDSVCSLALCNGEDMLVMVSEGGYLLSVNVSQLASTIVEIQRLNRADHVVSAFVPSGKASILAITHNGKALHRDASWLEPSGSTRIQGKALLSQARRQAGVRFVGAAAVDETDWGALLTSDGRLRLHKMGDVFGRGAVLEASAGLEILSFCAFSP
jgi:DNA gyrase/topoisomerase IV subunit A